MFIYILINLPFSIDIFFFDDYSKFCFIYTFLQFLNDDTIIFNLFNFFNLFFYNYYYSFFNFDPVILNNELQTLIDNGNLNNKYNLIFKFNKFVLK